MWLWLPFMVYEWAKTTSVVQWESQCNSMLVIESLISKFVTSVSDLFLCVWLDFTNKRTVIFSGSLKHRWNGAFWFTRQHNSEVFVRVSGVKFWFSVAMISLTLQTVKETRLEEERGGKEKIPSAFQLDVLNSLMWPLEEIVFTVDLACDVHASNMSQLFQNQQ
jgi:hypothetical protein